MAALQNAVPVAQRLMWTAQQEAQYRMQYKSLAEIMWRKHQQPAVPFVPLRMYQRLQQLQRRAAQEQVRIQALGSAPTRWQCWRYTWQHLWRQPRQRITQLRQAVPQLQRRGEAWLRNQPLRLQTQLYCLRRRHTGTLVGYQLHLRQKRLIGYRVYALPRAQQRVRSEIVTDAAGGRHRIWVRERVTTWVLNPAHAFPVLIEREQSVLLRRRVWRRATIAQWATQLQLSDNVNEFHGWLAAQPPGARIFVKLDVGAQELLRVRAMQRARAQRCAP